MDEKNSYSEKSSLGKRKKKGFKMSYLSFIIPILAIFLVFGAIFYVISDFKTGDFVYKKQNNEIKIGKIEGISLPVSYLVQWQDGSLSNEYFFDVKKISELSGEEIENTLGQGNEEDYYFYSETGEGEGIISSDSENVSEVDMLIPGSESGGGGLNFKLKIGAQDCEPEFICGKWQECQVEYDIYQFLEGEETASGLQHRYCKDYKKCMPNLIDSKKCSVKSEIEVKKIFLDDENYVEIYDEKSRIVSRIRETRFENFRRVDVEFII